MYRVPEYQDWYSSSYTGYDKLGQYQQQFQWQQYHQPQQQQQHNQQIPPWNNSYQSHYTHQYPQYYPAYYDTYNCNLNPSSPVQWNSFVPQKTEQEQKSIWSEPLILSKILGYTSLADLKNMRLVCKDWDEASRVQIRDRLVIRFRTNRKMKSYGKKMGQRKDFCERFVLETGPRISLSRPITTAFFADFGHHVRSLDLGGCLSDTKLMSFRYILSNYLPNLEELVIRVKPLAQWIDTPVTDEEALNPVPYLPKLKKLIILMDNSSNQTLADEPPNELIEVSEDANLKKPGERFIRFLHELLSAAGNLEVIESANIHPHLPCSTPKVTEMNDLTIDSFKVPTNPSEITEAVWSMLMNDWDVSLLKMKEISLSVKMSDECVQKLGSKWFHLTSIDLDFDSTVSTKSLQYLFSSLKDSLQHIKLNFSGLAGEPCDTDLLPLTESMSRVKTLDVQGFKGNLRFIEFLPNLQSLTFRRVKFTKIVLKDVESSIKAYGSLLSFKVYEDNSSFNRQRSVQAVQQIGLLFPSLKRLRLEKLVDESLCLIYAQWPNLEQLEIVEGLYTDAGTTAIHPNAYKVLLREEAYDKFNVEALRQGLHLGNLTKLRNLTLHSPKITDVTLILGAMQCPNLQKLCAQSYQISDTAVQRLAAKPTLTHLETVHCSKVTPLTVTYAQDKLKNRKGVALINKPQANMNTSMIFDFLSKNLRPKVTLKRLPEKKTPNKPEGQNDVPPAEESSELNDTPSPVADAQLIQPPPKKRRKRLLPNADVGLAAHRSKRTIIPKIVRDYYRIGFC